jgi:hypothetical protein
MSKLTMATLMRAHRAGGVLDGGYPGTSTTQNWDQYIEDHFDLTDPELVKFLAEWKLFLDAQTRFNPIVLAHMTSQGLVETD